MLRSDRWNFIKADVNEDVHYVSAWFITNLQIVRPVERHQRKPRGWRRRLLPHGGLDRWIFCTIHTSSSIWVIFKRVWNTGHSKHPVCVWLICFFAVSLNLTFPADIVTVPSSLTWLLSSAKSSVHQIITLKMYVTVYTTLGQCLKNTC